MTKFLTSVRLTENNKELIQTLQICGKREFNSNLSMSTIINTALYCFFNQNYSTNKEIDYYRLLEVLKCENQL